MLNSIGFTWAHLYDTPRANGATQTATKKTITKAYNYADEQGTLLYQAVRYTPKDFRQRRPDGKGGWIWNLNGVRRVLYRLPDILGQRIVLVTEGEKDADALHALDYAATANVGGAGKWRDDYARMLYTGGTRIVGIFEDNDDAGRKHATHVAASCVKAGIVASVIPLPDLPPKGDVSGYLKTHTADELKSIITTTLAAVTKVAPPAAATASTKDLAALLNDIETFIRKYVVLSGDASALMTLWIALTHALDAFDYTPYLHIQSPMPECGKSRTLEVLEALVSRPWYTGRVTAAVLMRKIDAEHPTLLLDESDAAFAGDKEYSEALRGQLNTGFHRSGKASACVGQGANISYKDFATFGAKAIAGIGRLDATIESRSIPIVLKRRTRAETIAKWRRREAWATADPLRQRAATLTAHTEALRAARPILPDGLSDRAEDVLEPLFALADLAGGDWPDRARLAALALMGTKARVAQETDQNLGLELLADIREIFNDKGNPDALPTQAIIDALKGIEDRPWAAFTKGDKPITP